jgi:hypothetical protein
VVNGQYYWDYSPEATLGHYSAFRNVDVAKLRRDYEELRTMPVQEATKDSPLLARSAKPLPRFFVTGGMTGSDLNAGSPDASIRQLIQSLNRQGWWPTPLVATSNPYRGAGPATPSPGDFRTTHVGDATDTSPYTTTNAVVGISTSAYIANMARLIAAREASQR